MDSRTTAVALAAAALLTTVELGAARADDKMQIGGFAGIHVFNDDNELGQDDFDDAGSLENALAFGVRVARRIVTTVSAEVELALIPTNMRKEDVDVTVFGWRIHGLFHPIALMDQRLEPFLLFGAGGSTASSADPDIFGSETDFVVHAGVGARFQAGKDWGVRLDGRLLLPPSSASETVTHDWEVLLGFYKTFGKTEPAPPAPAPVAAPEPVETAPPPPAAAETAPPSDSDGDGIADAAPDRCPNEKETANGFEDGDGCPDEVPSSVAKFTGVIQGITFRHNSAELTVGSHATLDAAAKVLTEHAELRIEIGGHTDNSGTPEYNRGLSQRRAEAVKAYLVKKGVADARLTPKGYGPDKPLVPNVSKEAQAQNRRVEFTLLP
ncbi:MAG TPA: OmpA family protein [Kofleriaceae bacterium]|nr:OmpA family protein [Kofleriaceae bacterium]